MRCVERDTYTNSGWGPDTSVSEVLFLKACSVDGCQKCESSYLTCTACAQGKTLNLNQCTEGSQTPTPNTPTPNTPTPSPNSPTSGSPTTPSVSSVLTNTFGLIFGLTQSRTILAVQVRDLTTQTLFSCAQLHCKYSWKGALLRISFSPSITVTRGELVVRRKHSQSSSVASNRSLQSLDDSDIVVPNIQLTQTPSYIGWVTAGQVLLWLLRTVGSAVLFPKYPKLAMVPDLLITMSFILCTFLGPVILVADSAFELVGQIKILWFRIDSLVENWDTHTLSLSTAPNRWKYPVFCSFLDNYSQNTVGLLALALLLTVAKCVARRVAQHKQSSPRVSRVAAIVGKHFGTEYWLAKVYANSLEIMLYSLISFDKADASSKSIIGIMLAVVFFAAQVWLAVGATLTAASQSGTPHSTEPSRPYEQRPDTVLMTETSVTTRTSPAQIIWTDKTLRVLCFGWHQMPSTNLKTVSRWKAFLETAFFLRNLGLCLVVLKVVSSPQAQLILAMCLQFCYVSYFVYCKVYVQKVEFVATLGLEVMMLLAIFFKTLSTIASISESNLQNALGALLLIVLIIAIILTTGCLGFSLAWNLKPNENKEIEPNGTKLTVQDQPSPQEVRNPQPGQQNMSNLKIIIEDNPKPSPTEVALEQEVSMHSVPNEGLDPQKPTHSDAVSQQNL